MCSGKQDAKAVTSFRSCLSKSRYGVGLREYRPNHLTKSIKMLAPLRRAPSRVRQIPRRLASTQSSKPALVYKGRIAKPAPPPPGPGETETPDAPRESEQAHRAILDAMKKEQEQDYKKRYKSKFRKVSSIIVALPIVIVLAPYLFDRREFLKRQRLEEQDLLMLLFYVLQSSQANLENA